MARPKVLGPTLHARLLDSDWMILRRVEERQQEGMSAAMRLLFRKGAERLREEGYLEEPTATTQRAAARATE